MSVKQRGRRRACVRGAQVVALFSLLLLRAQGVSAQEPEQEPDAREIVAAYNQGLRIGIAPGVFIPARGGRVGFSVAADVRYGFRVAPALVIAPGLRLGGYFPPRERIAMALGMLRLTVPIGPVGPYVMGGAGVGWVRTEETVGVAYLGGGGFMVHIGTRFGIGAEASYSAITSTRFRVIAVGPIFLLSF